MSIPEGGPDSRDSFFFALMEGVPHEFWANYLCYSLLKKGLLIRNYSAKE